MGGFPCNDPKEKGDNSYNIQVPISEISQNNIINNQNFNGNADKKNKERINNKNPDKNSKIIEGNSKGKNEERMDYKNDYDKSDNGQLIERGEKLEKQEEKKGIEDCVKINRISFSSKKNISSEENKNIHEKKTDIKVKGNNKERQIEIIKPVKNKNSKIHSENSNKTKKFPVIKDFYLLDDFNSIKDKKIYDIEDDEELILVYYYKNKNDFNNDLYKKEDFKEKYEFIYISCEDWKLGFLFPLYKYNINKINTIKIEENDIIKEIKNSLLCQRIEDIFNIKLESNIEKINDKNYILIVEKIKEDQNQSNNDDDIAKAKTSINNNESDKNITIKKKKNNNIIDSKNNYQIKEKKYSNNIENNDKIDQIIIGKKTTEKNNDKENIKKNMNKKSSEIKKLNLTPDIQNKENNISNIDNNIDSFDDNKNNIQNNNNNNGKIPNNINENDNNVIIFNKRIQENNNPNDSQAQNINQNIPFYLIGLDNIGSTCFMNATLQCLLHIHELDLYFLNEYPKDKNVLNKTNIESETKGELSEAYYDVIKNIKNFPKNKNNERLNSFAPRKFKEVLGKYNPQFSKNEANDSKDLITYLLQTFHSELNYFGNNKAPTNLPFPDSSNRDYTYTYFCNTYNFTNFSKISQLFYGTYENITICSECHKQYYSFQKFEIISFSTYFYRKKKFDIMDGFKDIEKIQKLESDNKYYCNNCNKLVNAEAFTKILELPNKLILNIDYGKNKVNNVAQLDFEDEIDLKDYLSIYFRQKTKFRLCSICTHIGSSGMTGHYITYCLDKNRNIWYKFDDQRCGEVKDKSEMKKNSPYLLIYELVL